MKKKHEHKYDTISFTGKTKTGMYYEMIKLYRIKCNVDYAKLNLAFNSVGYFEKCQELRVLRTAFKKILCFI